MKITASQYTKALYEICKEDNSENINNSLKLFVKKVFQNNDQILFNEILLNFSEYWNYKEGFEDVVIISARELEKKEKEYIEKNTENILLKKINPKYEINKNIIGGIKIKTKNLIIDSSIKTKLEELKLNIKN